MSERFTSTESASRRCRKDGESRRAADKTGREGGIGPAASEKESGNFERHRVGTGDEHLQGVYALGDCEVVADLREGDILIIIPWEHGGDEKGDILYKYKPTQVQWLKDKGYLKQINDLEDF